MLDGFLDQWASVNEVKGDGAGLTEEEFIQLIANLDEDGVLDEGEEFWAEWAYDDYKDAGEDAWFDPFWMADNISSIGAADDEYGWLDKEHFITWAQKMGFGAGAGGIFDALDEDKDEWLSMDE